MKPGPKPRDWKERYWEKVDKRGEDECWEWNGLRSPTGYGKFYLDAKLKMKKASRVAFLLARGRWPSPCALHSCDNPPCCNPKHLWEGTQADNLRDASAKGRIKREGQNAGEDGPNARLTWRTVDGIRDEHTRLGTSARELGHKHGVTKAAIESILYYKTWKPEHRPISKA